MCFSFTILGISSNLVPFYTSNFYSWNSSRNKTSVCGSTSYPRTNLPRAIPDPSVGISNRSRMNNPHIPLFPLHLVKMCNICADTPWRLSSCSPPHLCSSREVLFPDIMPIIVPRMFWMKQKMNFRSNSRGNEAGLYFHMRLYLTNHSHLWSICWFSFILLPSTLTLILNKSAHLPTLLRYSNHVVSTFPSPSRCFGVIRFVPAELAQSFINCFSVTWLHFLYSNSKTLKKRQERSSMVAAVGLFQLHVDAECSKNSCLQLEKGHQDFFHLQDLH